jgi:hypothetical protein
MSLRIDRLREGMAFSHALSGGKSTRLYRLRENSHFCHSERSLRSEESLFSQLSAKRGSSAARFRLSEISAAKNQRSAHPGESDFRKHSRSVPAVCVHNRILNVFDAAIHPLSLSDSCACVRLDSYNGIGQVRFPAYYAISHRYVSTFQLQHPRHSEFSRTSFERSRRESLRRQSLVYRFRLLVASVRSHQHLIGFLPKIGLLNHRERESELRQFVGGLVRPHPPIEFADLKKLFGR